MILDAPVVFTNPDGTLYEPQNYKGEWHGRVLLRDALAHSMNVPSLKVLDEIGFDAAIQRASQMLGITDPAEIEKTFPRDYPLGLGVIGVSPLQMARAFAVFANGGREVVPVAIRYIEDQTAGSSSTGERNHGRGGTQGGCRADHEPADRVHHDEHAAEHHQGGHSRRVGNLLDIWSDNSEPFPGKTGTTQNWSDAWTVGYSPYMCTAVWYGFDKGNRSLGTELTGAAIAGPTWAKYMKAVHQNLPVKHFELPASGLVDVEVSATSGLLPTACTKRTIKEIFLAGTEPNTFDEIDEYNANRAETIEENLRNSLINTNITGGTPGSPPSTCRPRYKHADLGKGQSPS